MSRRFELLLIVLLGAYLAAAAGHNVAGFPGLHGDEAWLGNYALSIKSYGVTSPHEMNDYTGPLYGWLMAQVFRFWPPGMLSLRLPGLILNLLAAWLMAWHLGRCCGRRSALAWLALLCSSAVFVMKSRVAWEVYAFNNILLAAIVILAERFLARQDYSFAAVLAFLAANFCGVLNHFIFLSVPLSIFVTALAQSLFVEDDRRLPFLRLAAVNLLMAATVFLLKPEISQALWRNHVRLLATAALAWPAFCAVLYRWCETRACGRMQSFFAAHGPVRAGLRRTLLAALALGLALFFVYHWIALMQIWSGVAVFQRLASWTPPYWITLPLYAWAAALMATFFVYALRRLAPDGAQWPPYERFLVHWPLAYAAIFIIFRNTNSIRYYIIPSFLLTMALAYVLPRSEPFRRGRILVPMFAAAAFLNVCFWREMSAPPWRRPVRFYVGWHLENSIHFADHGALLRIMKEQRICDLVLKEGFIDGPLSFLSSRKNQDCDRTKALAADYCWGCPRPPYFKWEMRRVKSGQ